MKTRTQSFLIKAVLSILCVSMLTLGFLTLGSKNIAFANAEVNQTEPLDLTTQDTVDNISTNGWAWDKDTLTLTLDGLNLVTDKSPAIIVPADSTIILADGSTNSIITTSNAGAGISCEGNLTMKSAKNSNTNGKLTIKAESGNTFGISLADPPKYDTVSFLFNNVDLDITSRRGIQMLLDEGNKEVKRVYSMELNNVEYTFANNTGVSNYRPLQVWTETNGDATLNINNSTVKGVGVVMCSGVSGISTVNIKGSKIMGNDLIVDNAGAKIIIDTIYAQNGVKNVMNITESTINATQIRVGQLGQHESAELNIEKSTLTIGPQNSTYSNIEVGINGATESKAVIKDSSIIAISNRHSAISVSRKPVGSETSADARGSLQIDNSSLFLTGSKDFGDLDNNENITGSNFTIVLYPSGVTPSTSVNNNITTLPIPTGTTITSGGVTYTVADENTDTEFSLDSETGVMSVTANTVLQTENGVKISSEGELAFKVGETVLMPKDKETTVTVSESEVVKLQPTATAPLNIDENGKIEVPADTNVQVNETLNHNCSSGGVVDKNGVLWCVTPISEQVYTGEALTPSVEKIERNGVEVTQGITIAYTNNINVGENTATAIVKVDGVEIATLNFTIINAEQSAPTTPVGVDTTFIDTNDGKITGVDSSMEYRKDGESSYTEIAGSEIQNLVAGKYYVRLKAKPNYNASPDTEITINKGGKRTAEITNVSNLDKTYDGNAVINPTYSYTDTGDGNIEITWYVDNNGVKGNALDSAPINAGTYWVGIKASEGATYNAVNEVFSKFVISKIQITKPSADSTMFTYNGVAQTYTIDTNANYTISNDTRTDTGSQNVIVKLNNTTNYEWTDNTIADVTFTFTIGKANAEISVDTTAIVKTYGESFTLPVANTNFGTVVCDKEITDLVNANTYTVTYTVAGTDNYNGDTKTVSVTINKATFDMSAITFVNKTVKYDGQAQSIEISGTLPNGVTVEYINNGKTDVGVYTITANFVYDTANYNEIQFMTATLTINKAEMVSDLVDENGKPVVIITSANGFAPNVENTITEIAIDNVQTGESVKENEKVASVIDITLTVNGNAIQPTESITIKLLIPTELKDKEFRLIHSHEGTFTDIEYTVDGDYVVFTTDNLSEFIFVYDDTANLGWLIGLLAGIAALAIASGIVLYVKLKKKQAKNNTGVK